MLVAEEPAACFGRLRPRQLLHDAGGGTRQLAAAAASVWQGVWYREREGTGSSGHRQQSHEDALLLGLQRPPAPPPPLWLLHPLGTHVHRPRVVHAQLHQPRAALRPAVAGMARARQGTDRHGRRV